MDDTSIQRELDSLDDTTTTVTDSTSLIAQEEIARLAALAARQMTEEEMHEVMNKLYSPDSTALAKATSRRERTYLGISDPTLCYSEVGFDELQILFSLLRKHGFAHDAGGNFVDIGCGSGKVVFGAALIHDFHICRGIEILSGLHNMCNDHFKKWLRQRSKLPLKKTETEFRFQLGDALHMDWSDANIVFINGTCFSKEMHETLAKKANSLSLATFVITISFPLASPLFEVLETGKIPVTWGMATYFVSMKSLSHLPGEMSDREWLQVHKVFSKQKKKEKEQQQLPAPQEESKGAEKK